VIKYTFQKLYRAGLHSLAGLNVAVRQEFAFRLECLLTILAIVLAFYVGHSVVERALLIASWFLILIVELINSAIETVVDRVSKDHHTLSKQAKDLASAAVFMACVNAMVVWGLMLLQNIFHAIH